MDFNLDITPWLLSSMISDLNQTANFTGRGLSEGNPFAKPFVQSRTSAGEVGLGLLGAGLAMQKDIPTWVKVLWALGHTGAAIHNKKVAGTDIPAIMTPLLTVKW